MKKELKEMPLPPSGGAWREDPETGALVRAITNDELRITNEQLTASPVAAVKEKK